MIGRNFLKGMRSINATSNKLVNSQIVRNLSDYGSQDMAFNNDRIMKKEGEANQRDFTYFLLGGGRFIYASAARLALIKVSLFIIFFILFFPVIYNFFQLIIFFNF